MPATVWKGSLGFGLVSFPIRLFAAARPENIHFHMLHKKDESRVKEVWYCAKEDKPIERSDMVKGYEYEKGKYVVVEDEELKKVAPVTASEMSIVQFVQESEVDPIFLESSYYVVPERAGAKPYGLLLTAMNETKYFAVAKVTMHNREHVVIIRPTRSGLVVHTMYFVNELHKANEAGIDVKGGFAKKELQLAQQLIEALVAPFKPEEFKDTYRENVKNLIAQKRKGRSVKPVKQPKITPITDLFAALQQSLAKPAAKKASGRKRAA